MIKAAQFVKGQLWVHFQGRTFIYNGDKKFQGKQSLRRGSARSRSGEILSPMPGKVTKIMKSVGDKVLVGEVILVLEAMKMEYTLKADMAGTIGKLHCHAGDQVVLGKLLVKIDE